MVVCFFVLIYRGYSLPLTLLFSCEVWLSREHLIVFGLASVNYCLIHLLKNRSWRKSCEAIYFILTDWVILCVLYVQFISPSIVWYNRTQGMLELWRNHSKQKRKINLQIFQNKKNNAALYHVILKLKFYKGTNITCAVCIHKEYFQWWAVQCHAMQSSPLLRYAVQIYFLIFLSTRDSLVTLLPELYIVNLGYPGFGMQLVWQIITIGEDRKIQAGAQPT